MYKCSECNKTYKIRPDYCDCGNDVFEEMQPALKPARQSRKEPVKKSFSQQHPRLKRMFDSLDAVSVTIFSACLILSFFIIFFINPKTNTPQPEENKTVKQTVKNIPDINKIWNSALPVVQNTPKPVVQSVSAPEEKNGVSELYLPSDTQILPKSQNVRKTQTPSKVQTPASSRNIQTQVKRPTTSAKKKTADSQVKRQTAASSSKKSAAQVKKTSASKASKPAQTAKKPQSKPVQAVKKTQTQPQKKVQTNQNDTEWYNYRVALRQALFHNLSVTTIQGSGKCGIEFSIAKNGKFLNRAFTFQSDNESVNQAVYKMMMKMPSYYPPPDSYNGSKIKMIFSFNNGAYYINYVN